jgi:hypothetical protein
VSSEKALFFEFKADSLVKSQKSAFFVILAKDEIIYFQLVTSIMGTVFHLRDDFLRDHQS